jgi:hypothetical protein
MALIQKIDGLEADGGEINFYRYLSVPIPSLEGVHPIEKMGAKKQHCPSK